MDKITSRINKKILIVSLLLISAFLLFFLTNTVINNSKPQEPTSNFIPSNAPATLLNSERIYSELEINQYEQLRADLTNYARNYKGVIEQSVGYEVIGRVSIDADYLFFSVKSMNKPSHEIDVGLQKKPQQRIKLSFTDIDSKTAEFDASLLSNSKRNEFIGTLPINETSYSIEYSQESGKFVLILYERSPAIVDTLVGLLKEKTEEETIDETDYDLIVPGVFEDDGLETEPIEGD